MGFFKNKEKGCEMTLDNKIGFVCLDWEEIVRAWNGNKL